MSLGTKKTNDFIRGIYPKGIHAAIADGLNDV